jgi:hypothetical protein
MTDNLHDLLINGQPLAYYGGKSLLDYSIGGTPLDNSIFHGVNRTNWTMMKSYTGLRPITLTIVFSAPTLHAAKMARSMFNAAVHGKCEIYIPDDGFFYTAYCKDFGAEELAGIGEKEAQIKSSYEFEGIRHGNPEAVTVPGGDSVYCRSTMPYTDARLTVTAKSAAASYTLGGAVFQNVAAGDVLCFDGINGAITKNGANYAGSVQWVYFPALVPGENVIAAAAEDNVLVEFSPAFI